MVHRLYMQNAKGAEFKTDQTAIGHRSFNPIALRKAKLYTILAFLSAIGFK